MTAIANIILDNPKARDLALSEGLLNKLGELTNYEEASMEFDENYSRLIANLFTAKPFPDSLIV